MLAADPITAICFGTIEVPTTPTDTVKWSGPPCSQGTSVRAIRRANVLRHPRSADCLFWAK